MTDYFSDRNIRLPPESQSFTCDYLCDIYDYNFAVPYSCAYFYYHHDHYDLCRRYYADNWTLGDICDMDVFE